MIVTSFDTGTTTSGDTLGLTEVLNTNSNLGLKNDAIYIYTPGVYEIVGEITVTSTLTGNTGINIYVDGSVIDDASMFTASAASVSTTLPIYSVLSVTSSTSTEYVDVSFSAMNAPTIVSGSVTIKKIS